MCFCLTVRDATEHAEHSELSCSERKARGYRFPGLRFVSIDLHFNLAMIMKIAFFVILDFIVYICIMIIDTRNCRISRLAISLLLFEIFYS